MSELNTAPITIKFVMPGEALRPYISTYYLTEVRVQGTERIIDWLHPEWANLRLTTGTLPVGAIGPAERIEAPRFAVVGPTSYATHFAAGNMRAWGIGLLPLGWAKLLQISAEDYADRTANGESDPALSKLAPFVDLMAAISDAGPEKEVETIERFFCDLIAQNKDDHSLIHRAHNVLVDPELRTVQEMAGRLNITGRSLDRLSRRAFGFPPKLLLRRQRFLRSLADNMLNPSQNWVSTLDPHYYDQAHFGRDFQRFMGMSASEYKAKPHPFLNAAVHGRMAAAGAGMQVLHDPKSDN